ncbi:MAG TPA: MBL fold metallo-hydrolase [Limnochordales bacterium]
MAESVAVVQPKPAASVILVRAPMMVYMTRRPPSLRFAAGYHVFPGGSVDAQDRELAAQRPAELAAVGLPAGLEAWVAAALRELFEEVGILLARDGDGKALWLPDGAAAHGEALAAARRRLLADEASLPQILSEHGWRLAGERLAYMGRWVTPPAAPRRFDTLFFLADVTGGLEPQPADGEVAQGEWLAPATALAREQAGQMLLLRPTRTWLQTLETCASAAEAWRRFADPAAHRLDVDEENSPEILHLVLAAQGVWQVPVPSPTLLPATTTNVYLAAHSGEALVIDAGHGGAAGVELVRGAWRRAGRPRVLGILLTHGHPDHAGAVRELAAAFQCPVLSHPAGAKAATAAEWRPVADGSVISVGRLQLEVLHTPGHAPDHICLFARGPGILFSGDNVVGEGSTWVGPPDGDMAVYLESLERLAELPARVIAPGHGPPLDDPPRRIRALIRRRLDREAQILALVQQAPRTVAALTATLYEGAVPPNVMEMARRTVLGHLLKLEREGRVRRLPGDPEHYASVHP